MNKSIKPIAIKKKGIESLKVRQAKAEQKKLIFIENYRIYKGIITGAAKKTGISTFTFYDWIKKDGKFRDTILEAERQVIGEVKDLLLQKVFIEKDLTAIIFYLKNKHPEFQQERMRVEGGQGSTTNNIVLFFLNPGDKLPKELQSKEIIDIDSNRDK